MNNVAFDVVVGLIFIYLLYSLYATVAMEAISSTFGLRARNLRYVIRRLLMDEVPEKRYFHNIGKQLVASACQILGIKPPNLKNDKLYKTFWEQPAINSLSGGGLSNTPSYIPGDVFTKALIDSIRSDDFELGVLGAIEDGIDDLPKGDTKKMLESLLFESNNDLVKFNILVQKWYDETMERATGWFKRTTQFFLLIIGAVIAFSFNVDTLAIIKKLSNDTEATAELVKLATNFSQTQSNPAGGDVQTANPSKEQIEVSKQLRDSLEKNIRESQGLVSSGWFISNSVEYRATRPLPTLKAEFKYYAYAFDLVDSIKKDKTERKTIALIVHQSIDTKALAKVLPKRMETLPKKEICISAACYKFYYITSHFWGYFITILALSLGAPFWFDLLNKVVKLRSSIPAVSTTIATPEDKFSVNSTLRRAG